MMPTAINGIPRARAWFWLALLLFGFLLAVTPTAVSAHAELLGSSLEDGARLDSNPGEIVLTFSEPVGLVDGGSTLHAGSSDAVELAPVANGDRIVIPLPADLSDGAYLVQWRVISDDGHPISGIIRFTIGAGSGEISDVAATNLPGWVGAARTTATAAKYIGLLFAAGTLVAGRILSPCDWQATRTLARWFALMAIIGLAVELPLTGIEQRGSASRDLVSLVRNLDSPTLWAAGLSIAASVATVLAMARARKRAWPVAASVAWIGLLGQLLSGHTRSKEPIWLMMTADAVHLTAAALWLGGVAILAAGLVSRWRGKAFEDPASAARIVSRFSSLAIYIAMAVIAAGTLMGVTILRSWDALVSTDYGVTLLVKIAVVALVLLIAGINRWRFIPRISTDQPYAMGRLKRLVLAELVLLFVVGGITSRLVDQDPNVASSTARESGAVILDNQFALDKAHTVNLIVTDEGNGLLQVHATLTDSQGAPVIVEDGIHLEWNMTEHGLGPIDQVLEYQESTGDYRGEISVPMTGEWNVTVRARMDRFTDSRTTIEVNVPD